MERIITEKNAKNRARSWSKVYKQSRTAITSDTVLFNILTNVQRLPARRRDFRLSLSEEEKKIGGPELSDVLASMVRKFLLEPKRGKFPFPRGRPSSNIDLDEERRGRLSYYEESKVKNILDEVVKDPEAVRRIDNEILKSVLFYRFLRYSFEAAFYQMKEDEEGFLNSFKPAIRKYGLAQKKKEELDGSWIYARDLTPEKIRRLSEGYALDTIRKFGEDGKNVLYLISGVFFFNDCISETSEIPQKFKS